MLFHVLLDSVSPGNVPMYQDSYERVDWVEQRKAWATELFKRGSPTQPFWYPRAMRNYKKAMLDLEVPCEWQLEEHHVQRNQMRLALHLNVAACGLKMPTEKPYPNLSTPKMHWDPQHDVINHCTRVLDVDKTNVKALYRRAQGHLLLPQERHINGLAEATMDLKRALELDPQNAEVRKEFRRVKDLQKQADSKASSMYTKMVGTGVEV